MPPVSPPTSLDLEEIWPLWKDVARRGRPFLFQAWGRSMWPLIPPGTTVEVTPCRPDEIRRGDVVMTRVAPDNGLLHRVVELRPGWVVTRGDWHDADDAPVRAQDVLGRVTRLARGRASSKPEQAFGRWAELEPAAWRALAPVLLPGIQLLRAGYAWQGNPLRWAKRRWSRSSAARLARGARRRALARHLYCQVLEESHLRLYHRFLMEYGGTPVRRQELLRQISSKTGCSVAAILTSRSGPSRERMIGMASAAPSSIVEDATPPWFASWFVLRPFQGSGCGRALVRNLCREMRRRGVGQVHVFIQRNNTVSQRLAEAEAFRPLDRPDWKGAIDARLRELQGRSDVVLYVRDL